MNTLKTLNADAIDGEISTATSTSNKTATTPPLPNTSCTTFEKLDGQILQNFRLLWLDSNIDEVNNVDSINTITKLRQVVHTVKKFLDVDECVDFMSDIEDEKIFMICSGKLGQITIPLVHDMVQINCVYIFCQHKNQHEQWAKEWPKVKGVYTDITSICEALKQATQECDHNLISISFIKTTDGISKQNLDQLDQSFMYTQILKEILLTIDFEEEHISEFLTYCREQFADNSIELNNVEKLRNEYHNHQAIWWYTCQGFLYFMLNRALRLMEADLIIKMGFFVRDLHNHIAELHAEQCARYHHSDSFTLYRGQGLSQAGFEQLKQTQGGLLAFNNFLSTSSNRDVSLRFARETIHTSNLVGVLFVMKIDSSITATPFANVENFGYYPEEKEILFSMHSVFRIGQVKRIDEDDRLWQVDLTLTGDDDPQLHALTERVKDEIKGSTQWLRLADLMIKLALYNKAENLLEILLPQATDERERGDIYYQLGSVKHCEGKYMNSIRFFENSLEIRRRTFTSQHPDVADCYNYIGSVYNAMSEYSQGLSYYEKALEIRQKILPADHPDLAASYASHGSVYDKMGEYSKALSYYEKALEIGQKTLPENHPNLATFYDCYGSVYDKMGEYTKALLYYGKALEIEQKILPANHPDLAASYNGIGEVYYNVGDYSEALSYYEKALEISKEILLANHPDFVSSYNNIGLVYYKMGEYSKALSYYEKALEIGQETLPTNHPDLAQSHINIGLMYDNMGEYSKALLHYEKALDIQRKALPINHPDLAQSYNNIGVAYNNMGEFSKALSYYERASNILQLSLPSNHPNLQSVKENIEFVKMILY
jgi:tetratricopeptide (TPR) repeat protein